MLAAWRPVPNQAFPLSLFQRQESLSVLRVERRVAKASFLRRFRPQPIGRLLAARRDVARRL